MKQQYIEYNPRGETEKLIGFMNALISSYQAQGYKLSVRQLYYQLVARDMVENTERSYKRVAKIINDARCGGWMDWEAIEDRGRDIEMKYRWSSAKQIVQNAAWGFHMDMWEGQDHRPFVVVEKAALAGILEPICRKYDVPLLAARGYPSVSVVRELVLDHLKPASEDGQWPTVIHLGDHDPSGLDMTRDLDERFRLFMESLENEDDLTVDRIALTMKQVQEKKPPPNPAKTTDARFADYRKRFGIESWELDALEPAYLSTLLENKIIGFIDDDKWEERRLYVEAKREVIQKIVDKIKE